MKKSISLFFLTILLTACQASPATATSTSTSSADSLPIATKVAPVATASTTLDMIPTATFPSPPVTPTATPYTTHTSSKDGMPQVFVPTGSVRMGGLDVHADSDELPDHIVQVKAFWLDQLEVTNGMYALCWQSGVCRAPQKFSSNTRTSYFDNPDFKDYPVIQVTWLDAKNYCEWAGRRLPTEAEWERAARGDDFRTFPWGDEPPSATYANFNNLIRDTSRVGSYQAGASPFGAFDMAGNVWEWVMDIYDPHYYASSPQNDPTGPEQTVSNFAHVIRGGSYQDAWVDLRVSNRGYELGPNPRAAFNSPDLYGRSSAKIGFRCASDN